MDSSRVSLSVYFAASSRSTPRGQSARPAHRPPRRISKDFFFFPALPTSLAATSNSLQLSPSIFSCLLFLTAQLLYSTSQLIHISTLPSVRGISSFKAQGKTIEFLPHTHPHTTNKERRAYIYKNKNSLHHVPTKPITFAMALPSRRTTPPQYTYAETLATSPVHAA